MVETGADHVIFATKSGEVLENSGLEFGDRIFSITALLSGIFNTTEEMASIVKEESFNQFYISGGEWKLYYRRVSQIFIIVVLFRRDTLLGTVRVSASNFVKDLNKIFSESRMEGRVVGSEKEDGEERKIMEDLFRR